MSRKSIVRLPNPGNSANPSVALSVKPVKKTNETDMNKVGSFNITISHPNTFEVLGTRKVSNVTYVEALAQGRALQSQFKHVQTENKPALNKYAQRAIELGKKKSKKN